MGEVSAEEIGQGRAAKANGKRASARPELTLEEALELEYPWKSPKKYAGKALKDVSTRALLVGEVGKGQDRRRRGLELDRAAPPGGILITEERPDLEATIAKMQAAAKKDDDNTAAATSVDGDGVPTAAPSADPNDAPVQPVAAPAAESAPAAAEPPAPAPVVQNGPPPATDDDGNAWGFEAAPPLKLVDEEEAAPEPTLAELSAQLIPLLDDARTPTDVREQILAKASSGGMRTAADYKQAIGKLTLLHTIGA
jgi:hypothetical protein